MKKMLLSCIFVYSFSKVECMQLDIMDENFYHYDRQAEIINSSVVNADEKYNTEKIDGEINIEKLADIKQSLKRNKSLILVSSRSKELTDKEVMNILNWLEKNEYDADLFRFIWLDRISFFEEWGMGSYLPTELLGTQYELYFSQKE